MKISKAPLLILLLLLGSYLVTLGLARPTVSTVVKDVTGKVNILDLKLVKDDGGTVTGSNQIQLNDRIQLDYICNINQESMTEIEAGDTFRISLPDAQYFRSDDNSLETKIKDSVTGETLGQVSLSDNQFTVTINETGARQKELSQLHLKIKVKAIRAGSQINAGGNGSPAIPKMEIIDPNIPTADLIQADAKIAGAGILDEPLNFDYVIVDKADQKEAVAFGRTERKLVQKGETVKVVFYKSKSAQGELSDKIDGNAGASGWHSLLKDDHSYLIREVPNPDFSTVITGGVGVDEGSQYDYQIEDNRSARFLILNQATLKERFTNDLTVVPTMVIPKIENETQKDSTEKTSLKQSAKGTTPKTLAAPDTIDDSAENTEEKKGIDLTKTDSATGEPLPGAEFELKNSAGDKMYLRKALVTDEDGLLHINPLPVGEYTLEEIKAPEGYVLDDTPIKFTFAKDDRFVTLTKENTKGDMPTPVKKEIPESSATSEQSSSKQTSKSSTSSPKKEYPATGMRGNNLLSLAGVGLITGIWLYRKRR